MMRHSRRRKSLSSMPPSDNNVAGEQNPANPKFFLFRHWRDTRCAHYLSRGQGPRPLSHENPKSERASEEQTETISMWLRANRDEPSEPAELKDRNDIKIPKSERTYKYRLSKHGEPTARHRMRLTRPKEMAPREEIPSGNAVEREAERLAMEETTRCFLDLQNSMPYNGVRVTLNLIESRSRLFITETAPRPRTSSHSAGTNF